jgi:IPT/TIG domain-containing protein
MGFIETFNQISYKKILSISFFMAVLLAVPVGVSIVQKETKLGSHAAYDKPEVISRPKATPGPIPVLAPILGRVFPWVGKVGDIIWIQGSNFGVNPTEKELIIGGVVVPEAMIDAWEDDMIQVYIPEGAKQGGIVELRVGSHPWQKSLAYVLYDQSVKTKLVKTANVIRLKNGKDVVQAAIWTGDDEIETKNRIKKIAPDAFGEAVVFNNEENLPILTIILTDKAGQVIPYYVDPIEFDF